MILDSTLAVGFRSTTSTTSSSNSFGCSASFILTSHRPWWSSGCTPYLSTRRNSFKNRIRIAASAAEFSAWEPSEINGKPSSYHPFEEIGETILPGDATLTVAETTRTLIEVNNKATLMFSGLVDDQIHENIFLPDLPYLTDEHGNIYFEVNSDEDVLRTLATENNNYLQVIIGLDTTEMLEEMELGASDIGFGFEDITEETSDDDEEDGVDEEDNNDDVDDDYDEKEWVGILEDELESDGGVGDWANLETMRFSHPMSFAKKMTEVVSDEPMDWMDQPSAGLAIQGLLEPTSIEERSVMRTNITHNQSSNDDTNQVGEEKRKELRINGHDHKSDVSSSKNGSLSGEVGKDENLKTGSLFYKLEMVKILLVSPQGDQTPVELTDFWKARPDAIAHTAEKIISRLKAGGEKTAQALKSLCWRVKGIQVEEATIIGIDCVGIDLRVCCETQVQTLRFAFATRATSEYSAERQLNELMFPRCHNKLQKKKAEGHPKEC